MRTRWFLAGSAAVAVAGLLAVPPGIARASSFQLSGFNDVVVDTAHGHVFVSPGSLYGSSKAEVVVTDLGGKVVGAVTGLNEPSGMALSPDDKTLYVALSGADEVVSVDTTTLTETSVTYPLPSGYSPVNLAVESGKLWVSYTGFSDSAGYFSGVGEIDLAAASPAFVPGVLQGAEPGGWYSPPALAVDPLGEGTLVAYDSVGDIGSYDVAPSTPTAYYPAGPLPAVSNSIDDIAVLPGGSQFVIADVLDSGLLRFSATTGQQLGSWYAGLGSATTVVTAANGLVAVGTQGDASPDVFVFKQGASKPQNEYGLGSFDRADSVSWGLVQRGLAIAADGSLLAAVTQEDSSAVNTYEVHGLATPAITASSVSLGGTSSAVLGKTVTLTGKLAYTVGTPAAKTRVTITRKRAGSTATRTFTVETAAGGSFRLTDNPSPVGTYAYTASYAGDTSHQPSAATRTVDVLRYPVSLTLADSPKTAGYHQRVTLTAHLGKTYTNRTVSVYALPYGAKTGKLVKSGRVNSAGNISVSYVPSYNTLFSVVFTGDAKYAPRTASLRLGVRVSVLQTISGYYKSTYIGGVLYRVYHQASKLTDHFTVTPNARGQCADVAVQVYYQGAWQSDDDSGCLTLSSASSITGQLGLSGAAGFDFRIRGALVHSYSANLANASSWDYFAVTS